MTRPLYTGEQMMPLAEIEDGVDPEDGIVCLGGPLKGKRVADNGASIHIHDKHVYLRTRVNLSVKKYGPGAHETFFILEGLEGLISLRTGGDPLL